MKLNRAQESAVADTAGCMLVSAGAGTGKTRVLVERFLHLVISKKASVTEILALTFTDKAAAEMKKRILRGLQERGYLSERRQLEAASISTIHAFAAKILREHPIEAGVAPDFRVIETEETDFLKEQALDAVLEGQCRKGTAVFDLLRTYGEAAVRRGALEILAQARHQGKSVPEFLQCLPTAAPSSPLPLFEEAQAPEAAREWQSFAALENWDWQTVEDFKAWRKTFTRKAKQPWPEIRQRTADFLAWKLESLARPWQEAISDLTRAFEETYENLKKEQGVLDFDDLQIRAVSLFENGSEAAARILEVYRSQYRFILVDEFQDTSPLQLKLVEALSRGDNLFFVGDYKQSIYAFRGAEPALFLQKEREYADPSRGKCVALSTNYRTVPALLDWINCFFDHLWQEDDFRMAALEAGTEAAAPGRVAVLSVPLPAGSEKDYARMREAEGIAAQIQALHAEGRGQAYGDIAILFEAMSNAALYEFALKKAGIPYFSISSRGFYQQPEIRDMLSILSFLENPFADIPLAACLRSPLFQVTDDALFWLAREAKKDDPKAALFRAVMDFETIAELSEIEKQKLRFFKETAAGLTLDKDKLRLAELMDSILEKTGYELYLASGADSMRRLANLKKLRAMARREETHAPLALGDFLKRIKQLELQEVRESEAQIEAEGSKSVVRLMTIHKSKGLEFKAVFIADMGRSAQKSDTAKIMAASGRGAGIQVRNPLTLEWESPAVWQQIEAAAARRKKEERKRLLYVAMTRAMEELYLCGVLEESKRKPAESFYDMRSWMQWLQALADAVPYETLEVPAAAAGAQENQTALDWNAVWESIRGNAAEVPAAETPAALKIRRQLAPRPVLPLRSVTLPVSAYAVFAASPEAYGRVYEIGLPEEWGAAGAAETPESSYEQRSTAADVSGNAADFGTAMHALLERLDFRNPSERREELLKDCFSGLPPACRAEAEKILEDFLRSALFKRLARAKRLERELPFVLQESRGLIQGVIDVLFQDEAGDWHVLDYKTAAGDPAKAAGRGYDVQIELYALACSRLLGRTPKTGILYFLKNQWQYVAEFDAVSMARSEEKIRKMQEEILEFKSHVL